MPRQITSGTEKHRQAQADYRNRLRQRRIPEVDAIDGGIAYGLAAMVGKTSSASPQEVVKMVVHAAVKELFERGYDENASRLKVVNRLRYLKEDKASSGSKSMAFGR